MSKKHENLILPLRNIHILNKGRRRWGDKGEGAMDPLFQGVEKKPEAEIEIVATGY